MYKLYIAILFLIVCIISLIIFKNYNTEYFKDEELTPEEIKQKEKEKAKRLRRIEQYKKDREEAFSSYKDSVQASYLRSMRMH